MVIATSPDFAGLAAEPRRWCVTGAAGFIGSHLSRALLELGQEVVGLDDFSTGQRATASMLAADGGGRFRLIEGDIRDLAAVSAAMRGARHVLHMAAQGSVPASLDDPIRTNAINVDGTVGVLATACEAGVESVVYASSSAVYGDSAAPAHREGAEGRVLSPYAASKRAGEFYAQAFAAGWGLTTVGLRYFNVYGARQDPDGPYAAVIPRWIRALAADDLVTVNGDGETTRDFCHVDDVVQANLRAAVAGPAVAGTVLNIGSGTATSLNQLLARLRAAVAEAGHDSRSPVRHGPARPGDIRRSLADIDLSRRAIGYAPHLDLAAGLARTVPWFLSGRG